MPSIPSLVIVLLVIAGIARLLIPVFPTDQNGSRFQTAHGTIHMILAIVIFAAIIVAASKLGSTLEHRPAWHSVKGWLTALPWVMTGGAVGTLVALRGPRLKRIVGLFERLFYVSSIAWFFIVAIRTSTHLLARPGRSRSAAPAECSFDRQAALGAFTAETGPQSIGTAQSAVSLVARETDRLRIFSRVDEAEPPLPADTSTGQRFA